MAIQFTLYRNANRSNQLNGAYPLGNAPAIVGVTGVTVGASTITVEGGGFGTKTQAAPVLAVFGSEVWENGVSSTAETSLAQGDPITSGGVWDLAQNVIVDKTDLRAGLVDQMYRGDGSTAGVAIVGWPTVMLSTPADRNSSIYNNKFYTSFFTKFSQSTGKYRAVAVSGGDPQNFLTGTDEYDEGEAITFDGLTGKVLHYDSVNSILHLVVDTTGNSTNFDNKTITGVTSGASTTAQKNTLYTDPGATKIFRAWENTSNAAIRTAFSRVGSVVAGYNDVGTKIDEVLSLDILRPDNVTSWHQVTFYADNSGATGSGYIKQADDSVVWSGLGLSQKSPTNGLTPSNVGFDLSGVPSAVYIKQWFGEIYVDTTPQRVVVGDNADFSLCTKFDHLVPDSWSSGEIVVKKRSVSGYLFVVDSDDQPVNTTGFSVTV